MQELSVWHCLFGLLVFIVFPGIFVVLALCQVAGHADALSDRILEELRAASGMKGLVDGIETQDPQEAVRK